MFHNPAPFALSKVSLSPLAFTQLLSTIVASSKSTLNFAGSLSPGSFEVFCFQAGDPQKFQLHAEPLSVFQVGGCGPWRFQRAAQGLRPCSKSCFHLFLFFLTLPSWRANIQWW